MTPTPARSTARFAGNRLVLARQLRGLLKRELAERISKTPAAIGQFENGDTQPDATTITSLAFALGVRPSFFAPREVNGYFSAETCHFRSLRSSTTRERRHLLARGALVRDIVSVLEEYVEFPEVAIPEVVHAEMLSVRVAEAAASAVRKELGLGNDPIENTIGLIEELGAVVVPMNQGTRRVSAFSCWTGDRPFVFLNNHDENANSRTRFDNLHELGHLVLHHDVSPGSREVEMQADRFASAFLIPREAFLDEHPRRVVLEDLREMKRKWGMSLAALVRRGYDLGVYSDAQYRRAYVELNRLRWRQDEPDEDEVPEETPTMLLEAVNEADTVGFGIDQLASEVDLSNTQDICAILKGTELLGWRSSEPEPDDDAR